MDPFGFTPAQYSAFWAGAQAVVLTVTLVAIYLQVREARRLRKEQHRPFVSVDIEVGWLLYISVRNIGHTMARDVRVRFEPPLVSTRARPWPWERSTLLEDGIPSLAPGRQYRWFFDSGPERFDSELPMRYDVYVDYDDFRGKRVARDEHIVVDLNVLRGALMPEKSIPDLVREVENIRKELHKWTNGVSGLSVHTVRQQTRENRWTRPHRIAKFQETRASKGTIGAAREWFDNWRYRTGWYSR